MLIFKHFNCHKLASINVIIILYKREIEMFICQTYYILHTDAYAIMHFILSINLFIK